MIPWKFSTKPDKKQKVPQQNMTTHKTSGAENSKTVNSQLIYNGESEQNCKQNENNLLTPQKKHKEAKLVQYPTKHRVAATLRIIIPTRLLPKFSIFFDFVPKILSGKNQRRTKISKNGFHFYQKDVKFVNGKTKNSDGTNMVKTSNDN